MEGSGVGIGRIDCYEDMFKEITRKLYGEDPDHRTSSIQNEFETSASYKNNGDEETGNGNDGTDDAGWTCAEEPLQCTEGSRVAAYHATKATWRCCECGECLGGGPREVAEHFLGLHPSRLTIEDSVSHHGGRSAECRKESLADEVTLYLERVRERAERPSPPSRRSQETQTIPAALLPPATSFLLHDVHAASSTQHSHLHQSSGTGSTTTAASGKRYACPYCPYGTDRRDLYTRHENIHREEKPFHCYVCYKPFNRADHVKKHFLRMHREHRYELARIRRPTGTSTKSIQEQGSAPGSGSQASTPSHHTGTYPTPYNNNKGYQLHATPTTGLYSTPGMPTTTMQTPGRRTQNGGCNSKSHLKGASKGAQERRYTCCYCSWSGVDNWCLKRHLNTHLKPFACALCEYKAARAERLSTHVLKVHNRRQCSRCSYLAEDAAQLQLHQLHVHRVTTANPPTAPPTPRHHQHLQPTSGGGRPPPGPPVFPAPTPPTATGSGISPTTILGHEMVDGPAAAASLKSQDILICENCGSEVPKRIGRPSHHGTVTQQYATESTYCIKCSTYQLDVGTCSEMIDRITRNYLASYEKGTRIESQKIKNDVINSSGTEKRTRKQQRPQKLPSENIQSVSTKENQRINNKNQSRIMEIRERYLAQLVSRKGLLKCYRCSRYSSARASVWVPYHTKASLALHALWRHSRDRISRAKCKPRISKEPRSVTLKATVYTHRADAFRGVR